MRGVLKTGKKLYTYIDQSELSAGTVLIFKNGQNGVFWRLITFLCFSKIPNKITIVFVVFKAESEPKHEEQIFFDVFLQKPKICFFGGKNKIVLKLKFQICISAFVLFCTRKFRTNSQKNIHTASICICCTISPQPLYVSTALYPHSFYMSLLHYIPTASICLCCTISPQPLYVSASLYPHSLYMSLLHYIPTASICLCCSISPLSLYVSAALYPHGLYKSLLQYVYPHSLHIRVECGIFFWIGQNRSNNQRSGMILEVLIRSFSARAVHVR